jgi:GcrA cell cycle regulator
MNFDWTPKKDQALREMLEVEGLSFAQAGAQLGVSRHAAIGRARRRGLHSLNAAKPPTAKTVDEVTAARRKREREQRRKREAQAKLSPIITAELPVTVRPAKRDANRRHYTLETLPANACKWPIGDPATPEMHFCGHDQSHNSPYCELHARLSAAPSQPKRPSFTPDAMAKAFGGL